MTNDLSALTGTAGGFTVTSRTQFNVATAGANLVDTATTLDPNTGNALAIIATSLYGLPTDSLSMNGASCNSWNEGLPYQVDTGAPTALVTVKNTYASQSGCANNPHLVTRDTILDDTGELSRVSFGYDAYNNVNNKQEWDWGLGAPGPKIRETQTTYKTDSAYLTVNLLSLPTEVKILDESLDGSSVLASDTQFFYDEGGISNAPNTIGHDNTPAPQPGSRGNVTSVKKCLLTNGSCTWLTTSMGYDTAGNTVSVTDANNHTTSYSYNDSYSDGGNRNSYAFVTAATNAAEIGDRFVAALLAREPPADSEPGSCVAA